MWLGIEAALDDQRRALATSRRNDDTRSGTTLANTGALRALEAVPAASFIHRYADGTQTPSAIGGLGPFTLEVLPPEVLIVVLSTSAFFLERRRRKPLPMAAPE